MSTKELREAAFQLFGPDRGWQSRFAEALDSDRASVTRWLAGQVSVPGPVAAAVRCWMKHGYSAG
jgi:hypothetical protein